LNNQLKYIDLSRVFKALAEKNGKAIQPFPAIFEAHAESISYQSNIQVFKALSELNPLEPREFLPFSRIQPFPVPRINIRREEDRVRTNHPFNRLNY
jgi:hypothetical protein